MSEEGGGLRREGSGLSEEGGGLMLRMKGVCAGGPVMVRKDSVVEMPF